MPDRPSHEGDCAGLAGVSTSGLTSADIGSLLNRLRRRGRVEIETTYRIVYGPIQSDGKQYGEPVPMVTVRWWANAERRRTDQRAVNRRFKARSRIDSWFLNTIFGDTFYEAEKPTLAEALADVYEHTTPRREYLEELVAFRVVEVTKDEIWKDVLPWFYPPLADASMAVETAA